MTRSIRRSRSFRRSLLLATAGAVLAISTAIPAAADTHLGGRGPVGAHYLADSEEYPGVRCRYDGGQTFAGVVVRDPFLFARDRSGGRDRPPVGWQVLLQRQQDESLAWEPIAHSARQNGIASDDTPADLSPIALAHAGEAISAYRVVVKMVWFVPGDASTVQGTARHLVDWYRWPTDPAHPGFCIGGIL